MAEKADLVKREQQTPTTASSQGPRVERALPLVDVFENDDEILIVADMPGVDPDGVDVRFESSEVTVRGVQATLDGADPSWAPLEFIRAFALPDSIAPDRVSAELKAGVLHLKLGKGDHAKPRKIQVTAG